MSSFFLKKTYLAAAMVAFSLPALADSRIRTETYSTEQVYSIYTQVGRAALIQLEEGERLSGDASALAIGHAEAWTIGVRGNNIVFKPRLEQPITNMVVISNKRTYTFDLKMANSRQPPTYILRFNYPDAQAAQQSAARARQDRALQTLIDTGAIHDTMLPNYSYFGQGSQHLAPTTIWDNGRFTYLTFSNGKDMPSIYRVEADGSETLLNTHIEGDTTIIHEVNEKIILRLGRSVLLIVNRGFNAQGTFNHTGTDDNQSVRLLK